MINTVDKSNLTEIGYVDQEVDPTIDLVTEIKRMKQEKNAVILAHFYQENEIQDLADFIGDSLGLARQAEKTKADIILFCGVHFMCETAKILNPSKKVLLPDLKAGCSLASGCPPDQFAAFKKEHPDHLVITYINCSAEIKALSDIICTSSNARKIVESIPLSQKIIFAPDRNLGKYIMKTTGREMVLWNGSCIVHELFSLEKITRLKNKYPGAKLISHPECETPILEISDFIGSTNALLNFVSNSPDKEFIVATETGILHQMQIACPDKLFIAAPPDNSCACNDCPFMKLNTLEKLYLALKYEQPEILMDESLRLQALKPIRRMLDLSDKLGV